jgi:hypothetical protein
MDISNVKHDEMYGYYILKKLTSMSETTSKIQSCHWQQKARDSI